MTRDGMGGWWVKGKDMTEMAKKAVRGHMMVNDPDVVASSETHLRNTTLIADSCELEFDIGLQLYLNRARWTRLIREYVPRADLERFVDQCIEIITNRRRSSTANMIFRDPKRYERKHRWGGCLMGLSFVAGNLSDARILTMFSRTTYIGYMGLMDVCLAHVVARMISDGAGIELGDLKFKWHIANQQFHYFKSLPHVFTQPDMMELLEELYEKEAHLNPEYVKAHPTWGRTTKDFAKCWEAYEEHGRDCLEIEKFGPRRRVKRRMIEYYEGIEHVSVPVSQLDMGPAE